jgi:hypothetical protein
MATKKPSTSNKGSAQPTKPVGGPASYFPSIERTYGRPISDWKGIIRAHPGLKHMDLVNLLKSEHGVGHGHANALVAHTLEEDSGSSKG